MVLWGYQTVIDRSGATGWNNLPDERLLIAKWTLPDIPLQREMTFTVELNDISSVNYIIARTSLSACGYFVDDIRLSTTETDGYKNACVLRCSLDVWGTVMVLSSSCVKFNSAKVPNMEMLPALRDGSYYFVGEETPPPIAGASSIWAEAFKLFGKTRVAFSVTATMASFMTSYFTVLSPEFTNYTEFQRIIRDIMTLTGFVIRLPAGNGASENKTLGVSTIHGAWFIPSYKLELNTTLDFTDGAEKTYDLACTGYGKEYQGNEEYIILGNLLGSDVSKFSTKIGQGMTPRTSLITYQHSGSSGYGYTAVGNALTFHLYPRGSFIDLSVKTSLATGESPVVVTMEINGNIVDITSSLQINIAAFQDRLASNEQEQRYALNLISSTVGVGAAVVSGSAVAAVPAVLQAVSSYANFFMYRPALASSSGSGGVSTILNLNGITSYLGCVGIFDVGIGSSPTYDTRRMHTGIKVLSPPNEFSQLSFFYQRPPMNYETNGFLQIDDPLIYPAGNSIFQSPYTGEVCEMLRRGIFVYNPNSYA